MPLLPPPADRHQRPRRGSLERPLNARLYRGTWLLVGLPLLVAAFSVERPGPLPAPTLPAVFDRSSAVRVAQDLANLHPDRAPGSREDFAAGRWLSDQLAAYGFQTETDRFTRTVPGRGRILLENRIAVAEGRSSDAIVVMAHRDNAGTGPGANDNASGTAALVELARFYAVGGRSVLPAHRIVFLSTDGATIGALGAQRFADTYPGRVLAVVNLDAIGGRGPPRLVIAGDEPRSPAVGLVATAAARIEAQTDKRPRRTSALGQLIDLAFPFSLHEQAPFVGGRIPAVTLTTLGERRPSGFDDTRLDGRRLLQIGRATQELVGSLDQGLELAQGSASYLYLGPRIVRGWAIEFVLIACVLPFAFAAVDLFARCRRRRIPLAPALRSYRSRLLFWLFVGGIFEFFALIGVWPGGATAPIAPDSAAAGDWPLLGLAALALLALLGWIVSRDRLVPRRAVEPEEELAGHTAALLVLGVAALLVIATNPFALLFLLPSLHAWLWLPQVRERSPWMRAAVLAAGFAGPVLLAGSFAVRFGLGLDAPWYLAELTAIGYIPLPVLVIFLAWLAAAAQLTALAAGRYAPYPSRAERPPRGPLRALVRRVVLTSRARRDASHQQERALQS